jgi:hypothetical protein
VQCSDLHSDTPAQNKQAITLQSATYLQHKKKSSQMSTCALVEECPTRETTVAVEDPEPTELADDNLEPGLSASCNSRSTGKTSENSGRRRGSLCQDLCTTSEYSRGMSLGIGGRSF